MPAQCGGLHQQARKASTQVQVKNDMPFVSQNAVVIALLVGVFIVVLITVRVLMANRRLLALAEEQALAIQKLSAEVFEMQNMNSEATRYMAGTTQALAKLEREIQTVGSIVSNLKVTASVGSGEGLQQLSKEIKKTLQSREVTEFLDSAPGN